MKEKKGKNTTLEVNLPETVTGMKELTKKLDMKTNHRQEVNESA